jgi:hypothetical protein
MHRKWFLGIALAGLAQAAQAQTLQAVMREGDTILGLGALTEFQSIVINDAKAWFSLADTTFASAQEDGVVLRSGTPTLREGQLLSLPVGAEIVGWDYLDANGRGDLGQAVRIRPASGANIEGALWNNKVVVFTGSTSLTGTLIVSPFLPAGTDWDVVNFVKVAGRSLFVSGDVDNDGPGMTRPRENTLMRYDLDFNDNVVASEVLATEGMDLPNLGITVRALGASQATPPAPSNMDANAKGDFVAFVLGTSTSVLSLNLESVLAQTGAASPLPLRNWANLAASRVGINDRGVIAFTGSLNGDTASDWLLVKAGEKLAQSGDDIPGFGVLAEQTVDDNDAPVIVTNAGDVYWRAEGPSDAFMKNLTPLVRSGTTVLNGQLVVKLETDSQSFSVSPNGRFFMGNVEVVGQIDTLLFMDFGLVIDIPGCYGNPGKLAHVAGEARIGDHLTLTMDAGLAPGDTPKILFATRKRLPASECGFLTPVGEIIARRRRPVFVLVLPPWDGVNPVTVDLPIPADASLVDAVFFAQGTFRTPGTGSVALTNGLRVEIGAP